VYYSKGTSLIKRFRQEGAYEKEIHDILVNELSKCPYPVFADVGANIGLISLFVQSKIPAVKIYAFEPGPHQFGLFAKTIASNKLSESINLNNIALSNKSGDFPFAVHRDSDVSGDGFLDTRRAGPSILQTVFTTTMDEWWQKNGCPLVNVIKLDTEGSELWVLQGAKNVLARCQPTIILEISIKNLAVYEHDETDILRFLSENRYQLFTLDSIMASEENIESLVQNRDAFIARPRTK
jgi:FkbM family methyltransferase